MPSPSSSQRVRRNSSSVRGERIIANTTYSRSRRDFLSRNDDDIGNRSGMHTRTSIHGGENEGLSRERRIFRESSSTSCRKLRRGDREILSEEAIRLEAIIDQPCPADGMLQRSSTDVTSLSFVDAHSDEEFLGIVFWSVSLSFSSRLRPPPQSINVLFLSTFFFTCQDCWIPQTFEYTVLSRCQLPCHYFSSILFRRIHSEIYPGENGDWNSRTSSRRCRIRRIWIRPKGMHFFVLFQAWEEYSWEIANQNGDMISIFFVLICNTHTHSISLFFSFFFSFFCFFWLLLHIPSYSLSFK